MKEKLKKMTNDQLVARRDELKAIGENPENRSADELEQLAEERTAIDEELTERRAAAARDQLRRDTVANMVGANVLARQPETEQRDLGINSPEFRSAWLKNLAQSINVTQFGEMSQEERTAFIHTTANTDEVVPTAIMNRIIELVESDYPLYNDATKSGMVQGFGVPRHTGISQGGAAATSEGVANDDEQDTFDLLPLSGGYEPEDEVAEHQRLRGLGGHAHRGTDRCGERSKDSGAAGGCHLWNRQQQHRHRRGSDRREHPGKAGTGQGKGTEGSVCQCVHHLEHPGWHQRRSWQ